MTASTITTGTTSTAFPTTASPLQRGARLRRRAAGIAMIGAGAVGLAGFLATPWEHGSTTATYLKSLTDSPTQAMIAATILHYGYTLLVPVVFVLARLARRAAPRLAAVGLVLGVLGSGLSGFLVTDAYDLSIGQHLPTDVAVKVSEGAGSVGGAMAVMGAPTMLGAVLGLVVLLVAMWRARWISWPPAVLMLAGWVASFGAHNMVRACTGFALVAVALTIVGTRVLRMSDTEFETGAHA